MVEIKEVQPDIILPIGGIGVVIFQPFIELSGDEPFRWLNNNKAKQIERIIRTLEIARQADHGCGKTHFTIFPEYSIPGLEGIEKIQEILQSGQWNPGTFVIGGVDGLTQYDYHILCSQDDTEVFPQSKPENVSATQWVNCCITWGKQTDGSLRRWVQLKLVPSWLERNIICNEMFCGNSVYIFKCKFENDVDCYFLSLVCFDWIGQINLERGISAIVHEINRCWELSGRRDINFIFVLQNNDKPNHRLFLENARNYFEERTPYPFAVKDNSVIIFANTAGGPFPGKYGKYGYSSLVCSPMSPYDTKGCPPTFSVKTKKLRNTDGLGGCKDTLFREMGACIHSIEFCPPSFVNLGPVGRTLLLKRAAVHPVDQAISDPRVPGNPVPAPTKWVNDQLDDIESILHHETLSPLRDEIELSHKFIGKNIRISPDTFLGNCVIWSVCDYDKWLDLGNRDIPDVDSWSEKEELGLRTVVNSLDILNVWKSLEFSNPKSHAIIKSTGNIIDVIVVSGGKTSGECFEYGRQFLTGSSRFGIVITRDIHESPVTKRDKSIFEPEAEITEKGPAITDPAIIHCGYRDLKDASFKSTSLEDLRDKLTEMIGL
jgi:hypothetical protein